MRGSTVPAWKREGHTPEAARPRGAAAARGRCLLRVARGPGRLRLDLRLGRDLHAGPAGRPHRRHLGGAERRLLGRDADPPDRRLRVRAGQGNGEAVRPRPGEDQDRPLPPPRPRPSRRRRHRGRPDHADLRTRRSARILPALPDHRADRAGPGRHRSPRPGDGAGTALGGDPVDHLRRKRSKTRSCPKKNRPSTTASRRCWRRCAPARSKRPCSTCRSRSPPPKTSHGELEAVAQLPDKEALAVALPKDSPNRQAVDSAIRGLHRRRHDRRSARRMGRRRSGECRILDPSPPHHPALDEPAPDPLASLTLKSPSGAAWEFLVALRGDHRRAAADETGADPRHHRPARRRLRDRPLRARTDRRRQHDRARPRPARPALPDVRRRSRARPRPGAGPPAGGDQLRRPHLRPADAVRDGDRAGARLDPARGAAARRAPLLPHPAALSDRPRGAGSRPTAASPPRSARPSSPTPPPWSSSPPSPAPRSRAARPPRSPCRSSSGWRSS